MANDSIGNRRKRLALKGMGLIGFLFFLTKGVMWLSIPALLTCFGTS